MSDLLSDIIATADAVINWFDVAPTNPRDTATDAIIINNLRALISLIDKDTSGRSRHMRSMAFSLISQLQAINFDRAGAAEA
jgi:hypothetical protein